MIEVVGKNGIAKIMTDSRDEQAIIHLMQIMSANVTKDSIVRIMADYHEGKGVVIGFTQQLDKNSARICPNIVGVDIGCNVTSVCLSHIKKQLKNDDFIAIDKYIRDNIALGAGSYNNKSLDRYSKDLISKNIKTFNDVQKIIDQDKRGDYTMKVSIVDQLKSVGSGNHFIEIGIDSQGKYWLTVHSGSRNFGLVVANIYQSKATEYCDDKCDVQLKYLDNGTIYYDHYLQAVNGCQMFSKLNHQLLIHDIGMYLNQTFEQITNSDVYSDCIETMHNYIDIDNMIIRKGAAQALDQQRLLIPFNMRDGIAICKGKGNVDYNYSAPHGAGRLMSRSQAKKKLDLQKVKQEMVDAGVFTTSLDYALDEAADAYKDMEQIISCIEPTVEVIDLIKPVYNIKGN